MRRRATLWALPLGLAVGAGSAQANLLTNGDLNDDPTPETPFEDATGWTVVEGVDGDGSDNTAEFRDFANNPRGQDRGWWLRAFRGDPPMDMPAVDADLFQDVPGTPGVNYKLSADVAFEEFYASGLPDTPTDTILALDFLDGGMSVIDSVELLLDEVVSNTAPVEFERVMVEGVAPEGTAYVRSRASMIDGINTQQNPQSAFFDNFELVPEPGTFALLGLGGLVALRRHRD